jgi:hypothetical protein
MYGGVTMKSVPIINICQLKNNIKKEVNELEETELGTGNLFQRGWLTVKKV